MYTTYCMNDKDITNFDDKYVASIFSNCQRKVKQNKAVFNDSFSPRE